MATHYAIIADFLNSRNDPACFDVSAPAGLQCEFAVLAPTGIRSQVKWFTNGFATSDDLFNLGGSAVPLPAVVRARTLDVEGNAHGVPSVAVLRQKKLILASGNNNGSTGSVFYFPLGDLGNMASGGSGAHLLIGNFSGLLTGIYQVGANPPVSISIEPSAVKDILLTEAASVVGINVTQGQVVVQLAIVGKGQEFAMSLIPPL